LAGADDLFLASAKTTLRSARETVSQSHAWLSASLPLVANTAWRLAMTLIELNMQLFVGLAGYAYQQITDDSGQNPILGGFRGHILGVGPQIGYIFPVGDMQDFLGLRGYGEFDAANRASGWNTWLTFAISPAAPTAVTPTRHLVTK
jgi:hypothetical protein